MVITREDVVGWMNTLQRVFEFKKQELTELDSAIGDADHGINMDRGFTAVKSELSKMDSMDLRSLFKMIAMTLINSVGGASGPLYGTLFLKGAETCQQKQELAAEDLVAFFEAGVKGLMQRGKAQQNDKTMVDAWIPAVDAMKKAMENGADVHSVMEHGAAAAQEGMRRTIPMLARKGRASYLGERSVGHQDPGATSSYFMIQTAADLWK